MTATENRELPGLMTEAEAAKYISHHPATLARERRAGRLPYVPGRPVLIFREDLLAWLSRRRVDVVAHVAKPAFDPVQVANRAAVRRASRKTAR